MAVQNTVNLGGGAGGRIREDLANFVSNIDRDETPFVSSIGTTKATSTSHSWITDEYAAPTIQTVAEGTGFAESGTALLGTGAFQSARTRLTNYTQIFLAPVAVTNTSIAVNTAGIANEFAYQLKKKGVEVRRNRELQMMHYNSTSSIGTDSSSTRRLSSVWSWVGASNTVATGGTVTQASGNGSNIPSTSATSDAALTRATVESLMTTMYRNGGRPNMMMVSATRKVSVSNLFGSDTTTNTADIRRLSAMESKLNLAINGIITDFGFDLMIKANYIMDEFTNPALSNPVAAADNLILCYDTSMLKSAVLRPLHTSKFDDNGDGKRGQIREECTLEVKNPNAVGAILRVSA